MKVTKAGIIYQDMQEVEIDLEVTKNGEIFLNGKELEKIYTPNGVKVNINNKEYYVARLVAATYIPEYKPFHTVRFINGNITDLQLQNLEIYAPSDNISSYKSHTRGITLENKRTGELHEFKSLADASLFLGYDKDHLYQLFIRYGEERLAWWHDYDIYEIDEKDTRVINREGKKITLRNKLTGELHEFNSLGKASRFLGKDRKYIVTRLRDYDNLPESSDYEIIEIRG